MSELAKLHDKRYVSLPAGLLCAPCEPAWNHPFVSSSPEKSPTGSSRPSFLGGIFFFVRSPVLTPALPSCPPPPSFSAPGWSGRSLFFPFTRRTLCGLDRVGWICLCPAGRVGRLQQAERLGVDFDEARLPGRADGQEAADCTWGVVMVLVGKCVPATSTAGGGWGSGRGRGEMVPCASGAAVGDLAMTPHAQP